MKTQVKKNAFVYANTETYQGITIIVTNNYTI